MDLTYLHWRKSTCSSGNVEDCVEIVFIPAWRKSSFSSGNGGNCVEVASIAGGQKPMHGNGSGGRRIEVLGVPSTIAIRDSKNPDGGMLRFSPGEWRDFLAAIKNDTISR